MSRSFSAHPTPGRGDRVLHSTATSELPGKPVGRTGGSGMAIETAGGGEGGEPSTVNDANTAPIVDPAAPPGAGLPSTILKASSTRSPTAAPELLRADAGNVEAGTVAMDRSGADRVAAERVVMTNSGARSVETRSAQLDRSGVVSLRGEHTVLHASSAVAVVADEARLVKGKTGVVVAKSAIIEPGARILVYAGPAAPTLRPAVDATGAAAFGAGLGLAILFLGSLIRRLLR